MNKNTYNVNVIKHILLCTIQVKLDLFSRTAVMLFKLDGRAALVFSQSLDASEYNSTN